MLLRRFEPPQLDLRVYNASFGRMDSTNGPGRPIAPWPCSPYSAATARG